MAKVEENVICVYGWKIPDWSSNTICRS